MTVAVEAISVRIVNSYSNADCTGTPVATFAIADSLTGGCVAANCSGTGYAVECNANAPNPIAALGANCGFDAFVAANCDTPTQANRLRVTVGACHNIDQSGAGALRGFFCGAANFKSIRPTGCAGPGQSPGFPLGIQCFSDLNCATQITTTTQMTQTTMFNTSMPTTPAPFSCDTCSVPAASTYSLVFSAQASFSYCDSTTTAGGGSATTTGGGGGGMTTAQNGTVTTTPARSSRILAPTLLLLVAMMMMMVAMF